MFKIGDKVKISRGTDDSWHFGKVPEKFIGQIGTVEGFFDGTLKKFVKVGLPNSYNPFRFQHFEEKNLINLREEKLKRILGGSE